MADAKKWLKNIEAHVLPSFFIGVLSQNDAWMTKTTERMLPQLEAKALRLAEQCKKEGECAPDELYVTKIGLEHYSGKRVKN